MSSNSIDEREAPQATVGHVEDEPRETPSGAGPTVQSIRSAPDTDHPDGRSLQETDCQPSSGPDISPSTSRGSIYTGRSGPPSNERESDTHTRSEVSGTSASAESDDEAELRDGEESVRTSTSIDEEWIEHVEGSWLELLTEQDIFEDDVAHRAIADYLRLRDDENGPFETETSITAIDLGADFSIIHGLEASSIYNRLERECDVRYAISMPSSRTITRIIIIEVRDIGNIPSVVLDSLGFHYDLDAQFICKMISDRYIRLTAKTNYEAMQRLPYVPVVPDDYHFEMFDVDACR